MEIIINLILPISECLWTVCSPHCSVQCRLAACRPFEGVGLRVAHGQSPGKPLGEAGGAQGRAPVVFPHRAQGGRTHAGASAWPRLAGRQPGQVWDHSGRTRVGAMTWKVPLLMFHALREHLKG